MKTITSITYSIGNHTAAVLHFEGEIKMNQLPSVLQDEFDFTNHIGESELVMASQFFTIGEDVAVEVDVDNVDIENWSVVNNITDLFRTHKSMYMLEGIDWPHGPKKKVAVIKRKVR